MNVERWCETASGRQHMNRFNRSTGCFESLTGRVHAGVPPSGTFCDRLCFSGIQCECFFTLQQDQQHKYDYWWAAHSDVCLRLSEVSTQQTLVLVLVLCLLSVTLCSWSKVHFPSSSSQQSAEQNLEVRSGSLLQSGGSAGVKTNQLFNPTSYKVVSDLCPHWYPDQSRTWWDWRFGSAPDWRLWAAPNYPEQNRCFTSIYPTGDEGPVSGDSWWAAASHVGFNVPSHEHWWFISRWSAAALGSPRSRETNMLNSFCPSLTHSRGPLWREPMRPQRVSSTVNKVKWKRNDVWILRRELRNIRLTRTAGGVCPPSRHWKRTFSSSQLTVAAKHGSVTPELWLGQTWS